MTKERPILFSGAMVRAILEGRKTQTRRVLKQATGPSLSVGIEDDPGVAELSWLSGPEPGYDVDEHIKRVPCHYGKPGDRIWVRETTRARFLPNLLTGEPTNARCGEYVADGEAVLNADGFDLAWWYSRETCPAIHMPRAACRLMLEVTDVRVERLNDCSEADAIAEGIAPELDGWTDYSNPSCQMCMHPVDSYRTLWDRINGPGSWDANPWVWVVEFRPDLSTIIPKR